MSRERDFWTGSSTSFIQKGRNRLWIWHPHPANIVQSTPARARFQKWLQYHADEFMEGDLIIIDQPDYQEDIERELGDLGKYKE